MPTLVAISYCPRCQKPFSGAAATVEETKQDANNLVREHLVRAQGADLDDGLHDFALAQWDSTEA